MQLQLTDQAVAKVRQLMAAENKRGHALRVAVQGGGCSGFQYGLTFANERKANDEVYSIGGLDVYVDPMSKMYLDGVTIDFIDGLGGSGFKFENPNASGSCGCGHSFSV